MDACAGTLAGRARGRRGGDLGGAGDPAERGSDCNSADSGRISRLAERSDCRHANQPGCFLRHHRRCALAARPDQPCRPVAGRRAGAAGPARAGRRGAGRGQPPPSGGARFTGLPRRAADLGRTRPPEAQHAARDQALRQPAAVFRDAPAGAGQGPQRVGRVVAALADMAAATTPPARRRRQRQTGAYRRCVNTGRQAPGNATTGRAERLAGGVW